MKPSEVTIRKAEFKDIPLFLEVEASQEDNTFSEHDFHNSITDSDVIFLVAEEGDELLDSFWALLCQQGEKRL